MAGAAREVRSPRSEVRGLVKDAAGWRGGPCKTEFERRSRRCGSRCGANWTGWGRRSERRRRPRRALAWRRKPVWQTAQRVLFFAPLPEELDVWPLLSEALAGGKSVALPRFVAETKSYEACAIQDPERDLQVGHFGIREPKRACARLPSNRLDLILVPGVAFDLQGRRLGRGKGYYDRLLKDLRGRTCGVAFDQQIVAEIPVETARCAAGLYSHADTLDRGRGAAGEIRARADARPPKVWLGLAVLVEHAAHAGFPALRASSKAARMHLPIPRCWRNHFRPRLPAPAAARTASATGKRWS